MLLRVGLMWWCGVVGWCFKGDVKEEGCGGGRGRERERERERGRERERERDSFYRKQ